MHQEYYKNYEQTVFSLFKWALIPDLNLSLFSSLVTLRSSIGETIIDLYVKIKNTVNTIILRECCRVSETGMKVRST